MRQLLLATLLLAAPALAAERYLGTLAVSSSSVTNGTTAQAFTIHASAKLSIQCDAASYVTVCSGSSCTAAATTSVKVAADQLFMTSTPGSAAGTAFVAGIAATGTTNCRVFERTGNER